MPSSFLFNLAPDRVNVPQQDWSGVGDLADRYQQGRKDNATGKALGEFSKGLDPETAKQVAPLLRDPQTRKYGLEMIAARMKGKEQPSGVQEYEYAKGQGYTGSFADWEQSKRKAGANSTTINMGEGNKFYDRLDEKNADQFSALFSQGQSANRALQEIDALDAALAKTPQGGGAAFKQTLGEWGVPTDGLDDIQATTAIINRLIPAQRPEGSGPMSDRDIDLFKSGLPRIINQPGGNALITKTLRGINQYDREMGNIAGRVANRELTPAQGRAEMAKLANPLAGFTVPQNAPAPGGGAAPGAPPRINSKAEMDALPPGTPFIAPDGSTRVKP